MQRDFESKYDEAVADAYYDARDEERAQADMDHEDDGDETGGFNFRQLAAWARARGDVAEAEKWEAREAAQDAPAPKPMPVQYTVTMTTAEYQVIYSALFKAELEFDAQAKNARVDLLQRFAAEDLAKVKAAMAILNSLNYRRAA